MVSAIRELVTLGIQQVTVTLFLWGMELWRTIHVEPKYELETSLHK